MKKRKWTRKDCYALAVAIIILIILSAFTDAVFTAAQSQPLPTQESSWKPPSIPHCDQELWLRIKDRCKNG